MQSVMSSLPIGEFVYDGHVVHVDASVAVWYVPSAQVTHRPEPLPALYVPIEHGVQAAPSDDPSNPVLQMQSVMSVLPALEIVFAGQDRQADEFKAPATGAREATSRVVAHRILITAVENVGRLDFEDVDFKIEIAPAAANTHISTPDRVDRHKPATPR
eukprot:3711069-Rhodomonas_salina.3